MKTYIISLILLVLLSGCIDPLDTDIPSQPGKLVVFAEITTDSTAYTVQLSRSTPYTSLKPTRETLAEVYVTDSLENRYDFTEIEEGTYVSWPNEFIGKVGMKYKLNIITSEDEIYVSDYSLILPTGDIVGTNFNKSVQTTQSGEEIIEEEGLTFNIDFKDTPKKEYYKIDWVGTYMYEANYRDPINEYCWNTEYPGFEINIHDDQYTNNSTVTNKKVTFLSKGFRFRDGYSLRVNLKSLTPEAYDFWKLVKDQTENDGSVFSSLPATIQSNIQNVTNPENEALGYFFTSDIRYVRIYVPSTTFNGITAELPGCRPFRPTDPIRDWCYNCVLYKNSTNLRPNYWMD